MSDRQNHVLAAIDGALDDWTVSGDAMRWQPPEQRGPEEDPGPVPDSLIADLARLSEATRAMGRAIAEPFMGIARAVNAALELERRMDTLEAIVSDETERAAYWNAAGGNLDRAIELAQSGVPVEVQAPVQSVPQETTMRPIPRLNIRIVHDRLHRR